MLGSPGGLTWRPARCLVTEWYAVYPFVISKNLFVDGADPKTLNMLILANQSNFLIDEHVLFFTCYADEVASFLVLTYFLRFYPRSWIIFF